MNSLNNRKGKRILNRYVFRKKQIPKPKSLLRLISEAALMLSIGIALLSYLYGLPYKFDGYSILADATTDLILGSKLVFNSILSFATVALVASLVFLCLLLVMGSIWRIFKRSRKCWT